jgi:hypothetical protein
MSWNNWTTVRWKSAQVSSLIWKCTVMIMKISVFWNLMYGSDIMYQQDSTTFSFRESQLAPFHRATWRRSPVNPKLPILLREASNLSVGICVRSDFKQSATSLQITTIEVLFQVTNFAIGHYPYFTELESLSAKRWVLAPILLLLTVTGATYSWVSGRTCDSSPVTSDDIKRELW